MNPIVNNNPTYSLLDSAASTSTGQRDSSPSASSGSEPLNLLRQPIPDHLGDYERELVTNQRSNALGQLIRDFDPESPIDFSGIDLSDIDISEAVSSGLRQQWTDVEIERYLNGSDDVSLASVVTNNGQLTPNQQTQIINGLVDSIRDSGIDLSMIPDSLINSLLDPLYASNSNITRFVRDCKNQRESQRSENENSNNLPGSSNDSSLSDDYRMPNINGYGNVRSLDENHNEYLAETTNTIIRSRFKRDALKSYNKMKPQVPESVNRQRQAHPEAHALQEKVYSSDTPFDLTPFMKSGMGNCDEMSGIAEQIINKCGGYARKYKIANNRLHAFTLVGQPPDGAKDSVHFSDYGKCWVVDPWANIACKASDYTSKFREKMVEWESDGKLIMCNMRWISPLSSEWVDVVVEGNKIQIYPESIYDKEQKEEPTNKPTKELSPPVREALDKLDPQEESTTTEDMQKALKKAKELGPDTFLRWLDEADVAKRLAEGILSGQSTNSCGLLLEDLANDLLDLLKEGAVSAKSICSALFPPKAKEFIMAVIPQLMLKPAGVRLTRLMEQLAQKDEGTRSDLIDSMSKSSCVPSIERANSEKSNFYERVDSVYERSVFPKLTAARKGKLRDHLPLAFYKQSSDTLETGNLMTVKHRKIASFNKIRNEAEKLAQALNSDELGHRTITPEMLRETQKNDDENYERQRNAIIAYRKSYIGNKISTDLIATAKQHMPEPSWVRNLNNLASEILALANESNAVKTAEWESRQERIEDLPGASDVATDSFFIHAMADAAIKGASSDAASMMRSPGRDITAMIGRGELRQEALRNLSQQALYDKFHQLWEDTFNLLQSGVHEKYEPILFSLLTTFENAMHAQAIPNLHSELKKANGINTGLVNELIDDGWLHATKKPEPEMVEEKVPERQEPAESSPASSPPSKKNKKTRQALLAD